MAPHSGYLKNLSVDLASYDCKCPPCLLKFDIDGDGSITSEELRHAMIKLLGEKASKNEIDAVVKEADNNGDGTVDFEGEYKCTNTGKKNVSIYYLHQLSDC